MKTSWAKAAHTLSVDEMPAHRHAIDEWVANTYNGSKISWSAQMSKRSGSDLIRAIHESDTNRYAISTGGNQPHNNLPPYWATNIWKRVG